MPRPDWNQTDPRKADYIRNKPSIQDHIVCVASGEVVSVTDASDRPLHNLTLYGKTEQFTTTGKNLAKPRIVNSTSNGITVTTQEDGTFVFNGTATENAPFLVAVAKVKEGETYTLSGCLGGSGTTYQLYSGASLKAFAPNPFESLATGVANATGDADIRFIVYAGVTVSNMIIKPQLEIGNKATAYEPYTDGKP
jgi:hypothetical protein